MPQPVSRTSIVSHVGLVIADHDRERTAGSVAPRATSPPMPTAMPAGNGMPSTKHLATVRDAIVIGVFENQDAAVSVIGKTVYRVIRNHGSRRSTYGPCDHPSRTPSAESSSVPQRTRSLRIRPAASCFRPPFQASETRLRVLPAVPVPLCPSHPLSARSRSTCRSDSNRSVRLCRRSTDAGSSAFSPFSIFQSPSRARTGPTPIWPSTRQG